MCKMADDTYAMIFVQLYKIIKKPEMSVTFYPAVQCYITEITDTQRRKKK